MKIMDSETCKKANEILFRFATDIDGKIAYGLAKRAHYQSLLAKGESVKMDYRLQFISETAKGIFGYLQEKSEKFNSSYPQDRVSTEDLKDIIKTALATLISKTSSKR